MRVEFYGCVYGKRYKLQVRLYKKCQLFSCFVKALIRNVPDKKGKGKGGGGGSDLH